MICLDMIFKPILKTILISLIHMQEQDKPLLQSPLKQLKISLSQGSTSYSFFLNQHHLQLNTQEPTFLPVKDMIGVKISQLSEEKHQLIINYFPLTKPWFGKPCRAHVQSCLFVSGPKEQIEQLKLSLLEKITNRPKIQVLKLSLIVYFNPAAGSNSKQHLQRFKAFIALTNFQLQIVTTQGKNHCKEHLNALDASKYHGVIIISGDGLMHEFVNSKICGKLPVCHIPAGSANAFSKTQTQSAGQSCTTETAAFLAVKGKIKPFNLWKVELEKQEEPVYSFLSVQWALLADIDINSEFLRCLGGLRFEVYSVWRCIAMRQYPAVISYSYDDKPLSPLDKPLDPSFHTNQGLFLSAIFTSIPYISDKYEFSPLLKPEDKAIDMQLVTSLHGRWNLVKYLLNSQTGAHFDREKGTLKDGAQLAWAKVKSYRIEPQGEGVLRGLYGIDGQHYEAQKLQVSRSQKQLLAFC